MDDAGSVVEQSVSPWVSFEDKKKTDGIECIPSSSSGLSMARSISRRRDEKLHKMNQGKQRAHMTTTATSNFDSQQSSAKSNEGHEETLSLISLESSLRQEITGPDQRNCGPSDDRSIISEVRRSVSKSNLEKMRRLSTTPPTPIVVSTSAVSAPITPIPKTLASRRANHSNKHASMLAARLANSSSPSLKAAAVDSTPPASSLHHIRAGVAPEEPLPTPPRSSKSTGKIPIRPENVMAARSKQHSYPEIAVALSQNVTTRAPPIPERKVTNQSPEAADFKTNSNALTASEKNEKVAASFDSASPKDKGFILDSAKGVELEPRVGRRARFHAASKVIAAARPAAASASISSSLSLGAVHETQPSLPLSAKNNIETAHVLVTSTAVLLPATKPTPDHGSSQSAHTGKIPPGKDRISMEKKKTKVLLTRSFASISSESLRTSKPTNAPEGKTGQSTAPPPPLTGTNLVSLSWSEKRTKAKHLVSSRRSLGSASVASGSSVESMSTSCSSIKRSMSVGAMATPIPSQLPPKDETPALATVTDKPHTLHSTILTAKQNSTTRMSPNRVQKKAIAKDIVKRRSCQPVAPLPSTSIPVAIEANDILNSQERLNSNADVVDVVKEVDDPVAVSECLITSDACDTCKYKDEIYNGGQDIHSVETDPSFNRNTDLQKMVNVRQDENGSNEVTLIVTSKNDHVDKTAAFRADSPVSDNLYKRPFRADEEFPIENEDTDVIASFSFDRVAFPNTTDPQLEGALNELGGPSSCSILKEDVASFDPITTCAASVVPAKCLLPVDSPLGTLGGSERNSPSIDCQETTRAQTVGLGGNADQPARTSAPFEGSSDCKAISSLDFQPIDLNPGMIESMMDPTWDSMKVSFSEFETRVRENNSSDPFETGSWGKSLVADIEIREKEMSSSTEMTLKPADIQHEVDAMGWPRSVLEESGERHQDDAFEDKEVKDADSDDGVNLLGCPSSLAEKAFSLGKSATSPSKEDRLLAYKSKLSGCSSSEEEEEEDTHESEQEFSDEDVALRYISQDSDDDEFDRSDLISSTNDLKGCQNSVPPEASLPVAEIGAHHLDDEIRGNVDSSIKDNVIKFDALYDKTHNDGAESKICFGSASPPPPPPPPPPGQKSTKKKNRRSTSNADHIVPLLPPPPAEKLKKWKESKTKRVPAQLSIESSDSVADSLSTPDILVSFSKSENQLVDLHDPATDPEILRKTFSDGSTSSALSSHVPLQSRISEHNDLSISSQDPPKLSPGNEQAHQELSSSNGENDISSLSPQDPPKLSPSDEQAHQELTSSNGENDTSSVSPRPHTLDASNQPNGLERLDNGETSIEDIAKGKNDDPSISPLTCPLKVLNQPAVHNPNDGSTFNGETIIEDIIAEPSMAKDMELPSRRSIFPKVGPSAFTLSVVSNPAIITKVLDFLGDPVAVCRMKMVNKTCFSYVEENEHTLMRDAVRLGGMKMNVRPYFWLWVTLNKGNFSESDCTFSPLGGELSSLERQGQEGKWHHVIERDVSRAFGTLPPHKTGARLRTDSIVRALITWGRSRVMRRGVRGAADGPRRGDESSESDDVSISPTDTVSDWGGVTPVGSFSGSFTSSNSGQAHGEEAKPKHRRACNKANDLKNVEELALSGNTLTEEVKASLQRKLSFILHALAAAHPDVGYCQGMDYLVAHLLRILQDTIKWKSAIGTMPKSVRSTPRFPNPPFEERALSQIYDDIDQSLVVEETCFRVMDSFFTMYSLQHFYWPELRCLKTCCRVFEKIIQIKLPVLADHFEHHELNVGLFALGWFQTLFLYLPSMPSATVCHMWDIWLVERSFKIFFRVGTAILFLSQPILLNHELEGMMSYLNTFPDATLLSPDILIACALQIKITNRMLMELESEVKESTLTC